jgi:F-type H+-transporting ATPase subunit b
MIDIDRSLIFQLINLLFLLWILNTILYRPIRRILKERDQRIGALESEILTMTNEIESKTGDMAASIKQARLDGFNRKEDLKKAGLQRESELIGEASRLAEEKIAKVKEDVTANIASVRESLKSQVTEFSQAVGEKILGRRLV